MHVSTLQNCEVGCRPTHLLLNWEMTLTKTSSLQGIVIPPIGCTNPYSSSAWTNKSWNRDLLRYATGIMCRFFSPSPTYTAKHPFGISVAVDAPFCSVNNDLLRNCLAWIIRGILIAMVRTRKCLWRRVSKDIVVDSWVCVEFVFFIMYLYIEKKVIVENPSALVCMVLRHSGPFKNRHLQLV